MSSFQPQGSRKYFKDLYEDYEGSLISVKFTDRLPPIGYYVFVKELYFDDIERYCVDEPSIEDEDIIISLLTNEGNSIDLTNHYRKDYIWYDKEI